jgi:hypothetical protein
MAGGGPAGARRARELTVGTVRETIQIDGVRCERCVMRLAATLAGHDGLESANATLMGELTVVFDDRRTSREGLLQELVRGGFRERPGLHEPRPGESRSGQQR